MPKPNKISAVILTFNEEDCIARCINSVMPIVDEIILVDSFSSDQTISIAQQYGARIEQQEWKGYAAAKNFGNEITQHDYILSIDADEVVSDALQHSILKARTNGLTGAYQFNRKNNYCGKWMKFAGWYPDIKTRIFPKEKARWEGQVHEQLVLDNLAVEHLKGDLLHYSIASKEDHIQREKKYAKLAKPYPHKLAAYLAAGFKFFKMYVIKCGFLEGKLGYQLCSISAKAKLWR